MIQILVKLSSLEQILQNGNTLNSCNFFACNCNKVQYCSYTLLNSHLCHACDYIFVWLLLHTQTSQA